MNRLSLAAVVLFLTAMNASADQPNKWKKPDGEPLFTTVSREDSQMNEAIRKGKATLPQFLDAIKHKVRPLATDAVKIKVRDEKWSIEAGENKFAYIWVWGVKEGGDKLRASVVEVPKDGINDLVEGQDLVFPRDQVCDWMISQGPNVWGGFTMRVLRDRMDQKERAQYDEYTGLTDYHEGLP